MPSPKLQSVSFFLVRRWFSLPDLIQKLPQLLPLALAKVQKSNSYITGIVDCLGHAREAKRHPVGAKLDFDPTENPYGKWPIAVDAATAKTDIDQSPMYFRGEVDKANYNVGIKRLSRLKTASQMRIGR